MGKNLTKKVIIEFIIETTIEVPKGWDEDKINFYLNESSYCQGNLVEQINKEMIDHEKTNPNTCNVCHRSSARFLKEE